MIIVVILPPLEIEGSNMEKNMSLRWGYAILWSIISAVFFGSVSAFIFVYIFGMWFEASVAPAIAFGIVLGISITSPLDKIQSSYISAIIIIIVSWFILRDSIHPTEYQISNLPFYILCFVSITLAVVINIYTKYISKKLN